MTGVEQVSFTSKTLESLLSTHNYIISKIDAISDTMQQSSRLKLDVPLFSGDNVLIWIFQMENFFAFHQTPCEQRLNIASLYMTGVAINWYHLMHRTHQISTWEAFIKSLELRFLNPESKQLHEVIQTSTVSAYIVEFEALATQMTTIGLVDVLDCFISGLRDDIKRELLILKPSSVSEAMCMAKLVEAGKLQSSSISPLLSEDDSVSTPLQGTMDGADDDVNDDDDDKVTSLVNGGSTTPLGTTDTCLSVGGTGASLNYVDCFFEEGCRRSNSNDFISQMPDEVLVTILSLLTIKEAATTSILSTRWRLMWRGLIKLNFHGNQTFDVLYDMFCDDFSECDKYINQVNSVIQSYNHPMIEDFRILYPLNNQRRSVVDQWLQFAVNKKVEFLELDLSPGYSNYDFPLRLSEMELVSLKKLILKKVKVSDTILVNLVSNSPNLETLSILDPLDLRNIHVGGQALKLKHFEILETCGYFIRSIYLSDFDLESFTYSGGEIRLRFSHLPKLNKVDLGQICWWPVDKVFEIVSTCASSLQSLSIAVYPDKRHVKPKQLYELPNVKQLRMMLRGNKHLLDLAYIVNAFPKMESFKLEIDWTGAVVRRKTRDDTNHHEHLKCVEIVGYKGRKYDFELVAYIINIADALKKIVIGISKEFKQQAARSYAKRVESILPQGVELVIL
ncbi:putative FBD-associated F-box protein At1g61330 [Rutidosis leptorrhynchoides]|uniref:putative FBD-associated F-box protein At1g61330 n=1 Tax=Rutidosis leptorrhynchoides TaxID=125765 RepID=UPI003A9992B3